ncbi:hypothetical protein ACVU7I_06110 [Patulibacter sp. S7RM1-6]
MTFRPSRPFLSALAVASGLAVAGCGGSGGDEDAYVQTYEGACKQLQASVAKYQTVSRSFATQAAKDPQGAVKTYKDGTTAMLDSFGTELKKMGDADAPDKWKDFQEKFSKDVAKVDDAVTKAKGIVSSVKTPQDLTSASSELSKVQLDTSTKGFPSDLAEKAPSCKTMNGSSSGA